ncbi:hypothetical protein NDU88_010336 [Pleurodeles waltl]|uniref:Uncharacterized protein n=1 Tax=Pleurodeles waltl TaxID=8319 RepID=A0AAV7S141_PLEWA|nr:hypothetical protein NDU88_010336 [Pleurodeles waltl]
MGAVAETDNGADRKGAEDPLGDGDKKEEQLWAWGTSADQTDHAHEEAVGRRGGEARPGSQKGEGTQAGPYGLHSFERRKARNGRREGRGTMGQ